MAALSGGVPSAAAASMDHSAIPDGSRAKAADAGTPETAETPESLAVARAKKSGKAVDVPSMRTEFSEVTARPDGSLESVTHTQPVRTRKNGAWVDIDPTLRTTADGMVEPKAALSGLAFSGGGDKPLVRMTRAGKVLELTWPKPLPEPQLKGETATYASVLPGVDLRLTATRTGFNQLLVVKTPKAAENPGLNRLRIGINSDGLAVREKADGTLEAADTAAGGTVFTAPKPMMYDSSAVAKEGPGKATSAPAVAGATKSPLLAAASADIAVSEVTHAAPVGVELSADGKGTGGEDALVLTPSQSLLDDPHTVYPVLIDPAWDTPHTSAWAGISRTNGDQPYYKFTYNSTYVKDFGTGYCASPGCSTADVKRVYYRVPVTSKFAGKHILSAEFSVYESHSYSCTAKPVQLYLTHAIGANTTWNNSYTSAHWYKWLETKSAAKGWSSACAAGYLEFGAANVKSVVQQAANSSWPSITFGLKAENESDAGAWKRFTDDASLRVNYNLPPRQIPMAKHTMSPGYCISTGVQINRMPQITVVPTDPDNEKIGVQFAVAWDPGDGTGHKRRWFSTGAEGTAPASGTFKASGSPFSVTLPTTIPKNIWFGWESRAWDGAEWGPWTSAGDPTACYVMVDTDFPDGPGVTSAEYPGSKTQSDDLPWTDGVGKYGTFVLDSLKADVVKYEYGLDVEASAANTLTTTNGDPRSVTILLDTPGPHWLSVRALDGANNASQPETYYFNVLSGHPQRAGWAMDEKDPVSSVVGTVSTFATTRGTGVGTDPAGHDGSGAGATLDNTEKGYISAERAMVDTDRSFTFSGWAKPVGIVTTESSAAITQLGQHQSITLGLLGDKWAVKSPTLDTLSGYGWYTVASTTPAVDGRWTHIASVYDATAHTLTLYVDGVAAGSMSNVNMWAARGAMTFGRMKWKDLMADSWNGSLDDIAVWDRSLGATEVAEAAAGRPVATGRPAKAVWKLDEPTDEIAFGRGEATDLVLNGATSGVAGASGKAVRFDGVDDYARTARPQVDTNRSFSVSAWVRLPATADGDGMPRMVVTQNGQHQGEFLLYYSAYSKKWNFGRFSEDATTTALTTAQQPVCDPKKIPEAGQPPCFGATNNEWTHLLGVSDAKTGRLRLFINGYQVAETAYTPAKAWTNSGGLQVGAVNREGVNREFFGGDIDDVRVYDRVVTTDEAHSMVQQRPQLGARWKFNSASGTPAAAPDEAGSVAENAVLYNEARIDTGSGAVSGADGSPSGSLALDGVNDYAASTATPIHTGQSFSVTGWARLASTDHDMTALSVAGSKQSAVEVGWDYQQTVDGLDVGQWRVSVTGADGATVTRTTAVHTYDFANRTGWNHLAVVYDGFSDQLSLYVNGALENRICPDDELEAGTCTNHVSWTSAAQPFEATGQVQFGRDLTNGGFGSYFSGEIDDVWMFQGALSPIQVIALTDPNVELSTSSSL